MLSSKQLRAYSGEHGIAQQHRAQPSRSTPKTARPRDGASLNKPVLKRPIRLTSPDPEGPENKSAAYAQTSQNEIGRILAYAGDQSRLLDLISKYAHSMTNSNLEISFRLIGKLAKGKSGKIPEYIKEHEGTTKLLQRIRDKIDQFDSSRLVRLCLSHTSYPIGGNDFLDELRDAFGLFVEKDPHGVSERDLGHILSACGKSRTGKHFLEKHKYFFIERMADGTTRYLVGLMWACGKVGYKDDTLVSECLNSLAYRVSELTLRGKMNLAWAFAKLDLFEPVFLMQLVQESQADIPHMCAFDILNLVWSFTTHIVKIEHSDAEADAFGIRTESTATPSETESWKSKSAELRKVYGAMCKRASELLTMSINEEKLPMIRHMLWFMAVSGWKDDQLVKDLCSTALLGGSRVCIHDVSLILWSLARMRFKDEKTLDRMCCEGLRLLKPTGNKLTTQISMCLYSLISLDYSGTDHSRAFIMELQNVALSVIPAAPSQFLANLAWCTAIIEPLNLDLLEELEMEVHMRMNRPTGKWFTFQQKAMLHQAYLCLQPHWKKLENNFPPSVSSNERHEIWLDSNGADAKPEHDYMHKLSDMQIEVLQALRSLGWEPALGHKDRYCVDLALVHLKIAVEVEGPHRFLSNSLDPIGSMKLKQKILTSQNWKIISIPFYEWKPLQVLSAREAYLADKIKLAINSSVEDQNRAIYSSAASMKIDCPGEKIDGEDLVGQQQIKNGSSTSQPTENPSH